MQYNTLPMFRMIGEPRWFSFPEVMKAAVKVIEKQVEGRTHYYSRFHVTLHQGRAEFLDANTLEVKTADGTVERLQAKKVLIATGSRPYRPDEVDFNLPGVYDSDTILQMQNTPQRIIVYGAGVIGCEYASIFAGLGCKVDLVNTRDRLLSFLDDEISDALSYHLRDMGVMVRHSEEFEKVCQSDRGVTLELKSGKRIHAQALLWCNGRTGNTDSLALESAGLEADHRGQLKVSEHYQTNVETIYAAGDVIGWPALAGPPTTRGALPPPIFAALRAITGWKMWPLASTPFRKSATWAKPSRN